MLTITDINKLKIYKVKYWCIYFKYDGIHYMLRHISEDGDHQNELINKETWEITCSDYTLMGIMSFLKLKYNNKRNSKYYYIGIGTPYKHIDKEYFVKELEELNLIKYEKRSVIYE